ncbi:unnamed protein product [Lampetra planeri]
MTLDSLEKVSVCEGHVPGDGGNAGGEAKPPSSAGTSTIGGHHHHHHHAPHKGTLTVPPPYSADERAAPLEAREPLDCWACAILLTAHNTCVAALNLLLLALVFGLLLLPAIVMVWFGFSCHSRQMVRIRLPLCQGVLNDNSSTALIIVGFVLMSPLLVLALAAYCRMARRLQLGFCFLPYSRAVYKPPLPAGLAAPRCPRLLAPCCCCYYTRGSLSGGSTTPHGTRSVWV